MTDEFSAAMAALGAELAHHFAGGVYAKETHIPAGMVLVQHKHNFEHLSVLASGTVEVDVEGDRRTLTGPVCLTIEAGKHHGVKAVTDAVWFCIHATDCTDVGQVDAVVVAPGNEADMRAIAEALR